ncbi:hypothetical protein FJZ48_02040 [Candidatus Uhrbacteria bacterium]|nr:hypothetical protein [Candidatus Uhrbacteria bacterium]
MQEGFVHTLLSWRRILAISLVFSFLIPVASLHAAPLTYQGSVISFSAPKTLTPGQESQIGVTFQNIGTATWLKTGKNFVSLYHWSPTHKVETVSPFAFHWNSDKRPSLLPQIEVKPGQSATFIFPIKTPSVAGNYHLDLILAAENAAWMKLTNLPIDIQVGSGTQVLSSNNPVPIPSVTPAPMPSSTVIPVNEDWSAELVERAGTEWQIDPGDHVMVPLGFKNTGKKTWMRDSSNYVSLYAIEGNKERKSSFKDYNWLSETHPVKLKEAEVKPGQIGHFLLELRAPMAPGFYQERFALAAENTSWIAGSEIVFPIRVPFTSEFIATAPPGNDVITSVSESQARSRNTGEYLATLLLRSATQLVLSGNGRQELTFGFKNNGSSIWNNRSLVFKSIAPLLEKNLSSVRDDSWVDASQPAKIDGATRPGEIGFLTFKIKAPAKKGSYVARFELRADQQTIDGGEIEIPITVTADGYIPPDQPVSKPTSPSGGSVTNSNQPSITNLVPLNGDLSSLPNEPIIRVGIFKTTDDKMVIRAKYAAVSVLQKDGSAVCRLGVGESTTATFDRTNRAYILSGGNCTASSPDVFRFRADDGISPMEIADFSRPVAWLPGANDNTFRAQLELRYTPATNNVWIINELPIEHYLKGIAETSNVSPQEFQRALLTAARTYALYHVQRGTKHANENYTVDATYDQVYRGYGSEARTTNVVAAVEATRGQIVTHGGKLAITPYYSRSDGRTRAWTEVWGGGPYPWLVSVPVPWDQGKTLWGHGVGMSASGALGMARDGKRYDEILYYFYQGTELRMAYK